jgi:hypothetical protein
VGVIENKNIAEEIAALMLEIGGRINQSAVSVRERCSAAEFDLYRSACDAILADILMGIVSPIEYAHPDLEGLKGTDQRGS